MTTKRMTAKDYKKELRDLKKAQNALKSRIMLRAKELMKENPDVIIHLSVFINPYKVSEMTLTKDCDADTALVIIQIIENDLAERHPHKQTEIEFPKVDCPSSTDGKHHFEFDGSTCVFCGANIGYL